MVRKTLHTSAKIIDALSGAGAAITAIIIIAMALSIVFEVVMRAAINMPTNWVTEYSEYGVVAAAFFGAAYAAQKNKHINIDVFTSRLSDRTRSLLQFVTYLWSIGFLVIFSQASINMMLLSWRIKEISPSILQVPMWIPTVPVVVGSTLLTLQIVKLTVEKAISIAQRREEAESKKTFLAPVDNPAIVLPIAIGFLVLGTFLFYQGGSLTILGLIIVLFTMLGMGTPIFVSLGSVGTIGLFITMGGNLSSVGQISSLAYGALQSFTLGAIPLFVFFGAIFAAAKLTDALFNAAEAWLSAFRGNLALATVASCTVFAAVSGSSVATAATIGLIAVPAMIARGYDRSLATGATAAGGTLGSLIPPSLGFIIYGAITQTSVGKLFIGGIFPGLLISSMMMAYIFLKCRKDPRYDQAGGITWRDRFVLLKRAVWIFVVPIIILGGIYSGIFTPTEAAAVCVLYAIILGFAYRRLTLKNITRVLIDATHNTCMVLMIIASAMIFGGVVTILQIPQTFTKFAVTSGLSPWAVVVMINLFLLVLGMLLEAISIALITLPIIFPAIVALGFDPVWFGVLFIINMEVCVVSPPVGLNLYVLQGVSGEKIETIVKGVIPFIGIFILALIIVGLFEPLATWLPSKMIS